MFEENHVKIKNNKSMEDKENRVERRDVRMENAASIWKSSTSLFDNKVISIESIRYGGHFLDGHQDTWCRFVSTKTSNQDSPPQWKVFSAETTEKHGSHYIIESMNFPGHYLSVSKSDGKEKNKRRVIMTQFSSPPVDLIECQWIINNVGSGWYEFITAKFEMFYLDCYRKKFAQVGEGQEK